MRILLTLSLLLLSLLACKNEERINIEGKWNLKVYEDSLGNGRNSTYSIFLWYDSGFEFVNNNSFYPRYGPPNYEEWYTRYDLGPGSYHMTESELILSYDSIQFTYDLIIIDGEEIVLENFNPERNQWIGKWTLVKDD